MGETLYQISGRHRVQPLGRGRARRERAVGPARAALHGRGWLAGGRPRPNLAGIVREPKRIAGGSGNSDPTKFGNGCPVIFSQLLVYLN